MTLTQKSDTTDSDHTAAANEADFESVFSEQWNRICSILYRLLGSWADAEDVALDTFTRLHERPPKDKSNLSGWLYRVAMNLGFNELRSSKRRQRYEEEAARPNAEDNYLRNPEQALERLQEREQVRITLARLKPRSAKLLLLRHSGFSYREIAETLDIKPASVGKLLGRAEGEFKEKYKS